MRLFHSSDMCDLWSYYPLICADYNVPNITGMEGIKTNKESIEYAIIIEEKQMNYGNPMLELLIASWTRSARMEGTS